MNVLTHRGYSARVEFDAEDGLFFGTIASINDSVGFHGSTVDELKAAFVEAVEDYLDTCKKAGKKPDKPFSGKFMVRVRPEVHANAARAAELTGKSLAQWADEALDREARSDLERVAAA
jgi:predicted HicB family RNase H-like nuclease